MLGVARLTLQYEAQEWILFSTSLGILLCFYPFAVSVLVAPNEVALALGEDADTSLGTVCRLLAATRHEHARPVVAEVIGITQFFLTVRIRATFDLSAYTYLEADKFKMSKA